MLLRSADVLEVHALELAHDFAEVGSTVGIVVPAASHEVQEGTGGVSFRDLGPESFLDDTLADDLAVNAIVGWLTRRQLPHDHTKAKHICLFSVLEAFDDFRSHPLVGANLTCHDFGLDARPAEISQFSREGMVQQDIQTFQVTMEDGLFGRVQVVDALCDIQGKLLAIVPGHLDLHIVQKRP